MSSMHAVRKDGHNRCSEEGAAPGTYATAFEEMRQKGFAYLPLQVNDLLRPLFEAFEEAIQIASALNPALRFDYRQSLYPQSIPDADDGFIRRMGERDAVGNAKHDKKWFLNFRPRLRALIAGRLTVVPTPLKHFLDLCEELYFRAHDQHVRLLLELAECFPDAEIVARLQAGVREYESPLRLLCYDLPRAGDSKTIAKPHIDRNGFTQHLGENYNGLLLGSGKKLFEVRDGMIGCFPGKKIAYVTGGELPGTEHMVVDTIPAELVGPDSEARERRKSAVFFGHLDCPDLIDEQGEPDYWACRLDTRSYKKL